MLTHNTAIKQPLSSRSIRKLSSSQTLNSFQDHVTTKATRNPSSSLLSPTNLSTREVPNKQTLTKTFLVRMVKVNNNHFTSSGSTPMQARCLNKNPLTIRSQQVHRSWISSQTPSATPSFPVRTSSPLTKSNLVTSLLPNSSRPRRVAKERLISHQRPSTLAGQLSLNQASSPPQT